MDDKFRYEAKQEAGRTKISLKGIIDEDTDFAPLKRAANGNLVINFKGITSINSCGIRTWVNFIKELAGSQIAYEECPPLIVRQMNMVPSFQGHAQVSSVFVPYVCDNCDTETMTLIASDKFAGGNPSIPETMKCSACGEGEMELDGNAKQYFAFAK